MSGFLHYFRLLILAVHLNGVSNVIKKGIKLIQPLMKESFKLFISNKNISLIFYYILMMFLLKQGCFFEENSSKHYFILAYSSSINKIIFSLLKKVIALLVVLFSIYIRGPSF